MPVETEPPKWAVTPSGDPIMAAKLRVPGVPPWTVTRHRLFDRVSRAAGGPLTLVTAPAGTGKTVLVSSWAAAGRAPGSVVWISLDEQDGQPGTLLSYLLAGLDRTGIAVPAAGDGTGCPALTRLAAGLSDARGPVVLVLDGAEHLDGTDLPGSLDFLLRHAAPQLRLFLVGRTAPELPLHRYRVAGSVTEIGFDDLAFTQQEIAAMLTAHEVRPTEPAVSGLARRTMGWAAGVRLAALAMQQGSDGTGPDGPVTDDGGVADYFVAEVLDTQPPHVRQFLLRTGIVDRVLPDLAVELSGQGDAARTLASLARTGTFIAPAPTGQPGYEYHPIVRDLLRAQLRQETPQVVGHLHRKAARWFAKAGQVGDAVVHACAGGEWEQAAALAVNSMAVATMLTEAGSNQLSAAFAAMPASAAGPETAVVHAVLALGRDDPDGCAKLLLRADELAAVRPADRFDALRLATRPTARLDALRLAVAVVELARARVRGEAAAALDAAAKAESVLGAVPTDGQPVPAEICALVALGKGDALAYTGDLRAAAAALADALAAAGRAPGCDRLRLECLGRLALVEALRGHLRRAADLGRKAYAATSRSRLPVGELPAAVDLALAWVHTDSYDPAAARLHVERAAGGAATHRDPVVAGALAIVKARTQRARGDIGGAVATVDGVRGSGLAGPVPGWLADRLAAVRSALRAASGLPEPPPGPDAGPGGPDTCAAERVVAGALSRFAAGAVAEAGALLSPVLTHAGVPLDVRVESWLLSAACELAQGRTDLARTALDRALRLAEPERLRRPVFEAPPRLRRFLRQTTELAERHAWLGSGAADTPDRGLAGRTAPGPTLLVEALTEKESEVLRYLAAMLSTEEIARTMFVSVNTVKTHIRGVLRKLAASRRNEAVRRARQLGLV